MDTSFDHGLPHVDRVKSYAHLIVRGEGISVNEELLLAGIYLHDTGRILGEPHAQYSALIARSLLLELGYPDDFIEKVVNMILYHSYSYAWSHGVKPLTVEAKVLSDADKLDALGVTGFARVIAYSARMNRGIEETINHIYTKLYNLKPLLHYETSRRLADELTEALRYTTNRLIDELSLLGFNINK